MILGTGNGALAGIIVGLVAIVVMAGILAYRSNSGHRHANA